MECDINKTSKQGMKDSQLREVICKKYCIYYKAGKKEKLSCETYNFLKRSLTERELLSLEHLRYPSPTEMDSYIREKICKNCDFFIDGCDFVMGESDTPCGGYLFLKKISSESR